MSKSERPIGVDLFAGAGGMSLGFEQAGFDVMAAVEIDPVHAAVHKFNFPECAVLPRSVVGLTGAEIRKRSGIGNRTVDVVFGGAPCQGFSLIGHRVLDDPRNSLVKEFVRIVCELEARFFVFENVKGLTVGRHRKFLDELIEAFEDVGYIVRSPWSVLNAASYGVPQSRERFFLLGARKGLATPKYPTETTHLPGNPILGLAPAPTCRDALGDLPDVDRFAELFNSDSIKTTKWAKLSVYARTLRCLDNDSWGFGYPRDWDSTLLTSSMRTEHTDISQRRFRNTEPGAVEPISRFFRLPADGLSNTLRAGTDSARGAFTSPRPIHYEHARCVTVREMARLHGFPDWFRLHSTKWHGARQIGNAVPPPLARAVASEVLKAGRRTPTVPGRTMALGDPALLEMDVSAASEYWGIDNPIRGRDRKSGAKKRKQEDIEALRAAAE